MDEGHTQRTRTDTAVFLHYNNICMSGVVSGRKLSLCDNILGFLNNLFSK